MTDLNAAVDSYLELIRADYRNWQNDCRSPDMIGDEIRDRVRQEMTDRFVNSVQVESGSKYLRVVVSGSAHSFIMLRDDAKFQRGDILKAASWRAPARNFARGNVFTVTKISWAGA